MGWCVSPQREESIYSEGTLTSGKQVLARSYNCHPHACPPPSWVEASVCSNSHPSSTCSLSPPQGTHCSLYLQDQMETHAAETQLTRSSKNAQQWLRCKGKIKTTCPEFSLFQELVFSSEMGLFVVASPAPPPPGHIWSECLNF